MTAIERISSSGDLRETENRKEAPRSITKVVKIALEILRSAALLPLVLIESLCHGSKIYWTEKNFPCSHSNSQGEQVAFANNCAANVRFCPSGPSSLKWKQNLIANANHSLEIAGSYCGGKAFDETLDLLEDKLNNNKQIVIRILSSPIHLSKAQIERMQRLQGKFPNRFQAQITANRWILFPKLKMEEQHAKMLVADQKYFVTGGQNIMNWQLSPSELQELNYEGTQGMGVFHDIDIAGTGDVAKQMKSYFDELWVNWKNWNRQEPTPALDHGQEPENPAVIEALDNGLPGECALFTSSAGQGAANRNEAKYLELIASAQDRIYISNMLFNRKSIIEALEGAIRRGIKVSVLTNGVSPKICIPANTQASRNLRNLKRLWNASREENAGEFDCSLMQRKRTFLHTKAMVVDSDTFVIGSFNIDRKGARCDDEMLLTFRSKEIAEEAAFYFDEQRELMKQPKFDSRRFAISSAIGFVVDRAMRNVL